MSYPFPATINNLSQTEAIKLLLLLFTGGTGIVPPGGGASVITVQPTVTSVSVAVPQSTSGSIPAGAKGWTFTVLTGTATFNGVAGLPASFSDSDPNVTGAAISYATAGTSTAYVRYGT